MREAVSDSDIISFIDYKRLGLVLPPQAAVYYAKFEYTSTASPKLHVLLHFKHIKTRLSDAKP